MASDKRATFLLLHESDLRAAGASIAQELHEGFCVSMDEGMNLALGQLGYDEDDFDLLIPSLKHHLHASLAKLNVKAAAGWSDVFFTNLNETYNNGGEM